jgi:hypothetical protein
LRAATFTWHCSLTHGVAYKQKIIAGVANNDAQLKMNGSNTRGRQNFKQQT